MMKSKDLTVFIAFVIVGIIVLGVIYAIDASYSEENPPQTINHTELEQKCTILGGTYLSKYHECEYIDTEACEIMSGTFNECESACRHDPSAEVCIDVCVPVCKI